MVKLKSLQSGCYPHKPLAVHKPQWFHQAHRNRPHRHQDTKVTVLWCIINVTITIVIHTVAELNAIWICRWLYIIAVFFVAHKPIYGLTTVLFCALKSITITIRVLVPHIFVTSCGSASSIKVSLMSSIHCRLRWHWDAHQDCYRRSQGQHYSHLYHCPLRKVFVRWTTGHSEARTGQNQYYLSNQSYSSHYILPMHMGSNAKINPIFIFAKRCFSFVCCISWYAVDKSFMSEQNIPKPWSDVQTAHFVLEHLTVFYLTMCSTTSNMNT